MTEILFFASVLRRVDDVDFAADGVRASRDFDVAEVALVVAFDFEVVGGQQRCCEHGAVEGFAFNLEGQHDLYCVRVCPADVFEAPDDGGVEA